MLVEAEGDGCNDAISIDLLNCFEDLFCRYLPCTGVYGCSYDEVSIYNGIEGDDRVNPMVYLNLLSFISI